MYRSLIRSRALKSAESNLCARAGAVTALTGKVRVAQLEVDGVSFEMPETKGPGFWKSLPYDEHGIVDFDAVSGELFAAMRRSLELCVRKTRMS